MNLCFLIGEIIGEIQFDFILNGKNISVARFRLKVNENCEIIVKAYDKIADWCYQNLVKSDIVAIEGKLDSKMEVKINNIEHND